MTTLPTDIPRTVLIRGLAYGLAAVAMWAAYMAFARLGVLAGLSAFDLVFLRVATAALVLLPWLVRHGLRTLGGVGWGRAAVMSIFAGPVFVALGVGGYAFAPLSHGAVIQPSVAALGGVVLAALVLREPLGAARLAGTVVLICGIALIASRSVGTEVPAGPRAWIGDLSFAGAGLFWVGFTLSLKRWAMGAVAATAALSLVSALVVVPAYLLFGDLARLAALPWPMLLAQIVVQGIMAGVLGLVAYGRAVTLLGAGRAGLFPALVPAATLVIGIPVTGEVPGPVEVAGAALATLGLAIALDALPRRTGSGT